MIARLSQTQADQAVALCDRILETCAKLERDFAALKAASDQFAADLEATYGATASKT